MPPVCACQAALPVDWSQERRCEDRFPPVLLRRGCRCRRVGSACRPIQEGCLSDLHRAGRTVNPDGWVRLDVVHRLDAVAIRFAVPRRLQDEESPVWREPRFQASSVGGDPPVPAWPVSAGKAPFGSPVIWAGAVLAVGELGVLPPRSVLDGLEPYCGVWLL